MIQGGRGQRQGQGGFIVIFNSGKLVPDILKKYQERFQYILVDEYQDTNKIQYNLCKMLASKNRNIFVVGDIDQSIFSWRKADYENILLFEKIIGVPL